MQTTAATIQVDLLAIFFTNAVPPTYNAPCLPACFAASIIVEAPVFAAAATADPASVEA